MTVSYMPLIRAQQKAHGPKVVDRHFSSSVDILAAGRAARQRLMGRHVQAEPYLPPEPEPEVFEPAIQVVAPAAPEVPEPTVGVPLDMLLPCSWKFLLALAALRNDVTAEAIVGLARQPHVIRARHDAMALIYQHTQNSSPMVGRFVGRDHSSVLHALKKLGRKKKLVDLVVTEPVAVRNKGGRPRDGKADAIREAYQQGIPVPEISLRLGISVQSIRSRAHHMGLKHPMPGRPKGQKPLAEIVGAENCEEYRRLTHNLGFKAAEARRILGVHQ